MLSSFFVISDINTSTFLFMNLFIHGKEYMHYIADILMLTSARKSEDTTVCQTFSCYKPRREGHPRNFDKNHLFLFLNSSPNGPCIGKACVTMFVTKVANRNTKQI